MKKYITTAIDYVNSLPHIGTAYEKIGADVIARFYRFLGHEVLFQMGNDEHSANVQKAAQAKKMTPKDYCDGMRPNFENIWQKLDISYNQFIQTSDPQHHHAVTEFFKRIFSSGDVEERDYEGWYCESCEAFYTDKDLVDGVCPHHKSKPKWLQEKNYFFKLSRYTQFLLDHIENNPQFILPQKRKNEVINFIKSGLEDISISRSSFDWGIPVPVNPGHVVYVWFDALINYITFIGYATDPKKFQHYWPADLHIIGKDITRFHCIIWPAMLKSAGLELPKNILGHGFVYLKGEKMSKSLGNVVTPLDVLEKFPDFGSDALRYYLLRGSSFGDDGDFTWDGFIERYNADLANGLGNLVSRTLGMVWQYQNGEIQPLPVAAASQLQFLQDIQKTLQLSLAHLDPVQAQDLQTHFALEKIWSCVAKMDQYIDQQAPWALAKQKQTEQLSLVLTTLVEGLRLITVLTGLFLPRSARQIWLAFDFEKIKNFNDISHADLMTMPALTETHLLKEKKQIIFPKIESKVMTEATPPAPSKNDKTKDEGAEAATIDIQDFAKVDLRVVKITAAKKIPDADRLLLLQVDLDGESRQIVAGIAQFYEPESLVGQHVVIVANLKKAKIRGYESHGMVLAAKDGAVLSVLQPQRLVKSGTKIS